MNVHISYRVSKTSDLEKLLNHQVEKLGKHLRVFRPELVHLKGSVEENSARAGFVTSMNLRLPSGQMVSQENGPTVKAAVTAAFDSISEQLKKHKAQLRSRHKWLRRRAPQRAVGTTPFEQTVAAVHPEKVSHDDISGYIDVNLPRFERFIERQISYREGESQLAPGQVSAAEVLDEAIASALSEQQDQPERMKLEPWLYRLANQAIDQLSSPDGSEDNVPLERSHGVQNVQATDEALLQFHQPDDRLREENVIPDANAASPEDLAARRELIGLVEHALGTAGPAEREAFILYTVEGFTLHEIADITSSSVEEVRASIRKGREHLQRALPIKDPLKEKLVEYSRSA